MWARKDDWIVWIFAYVGVDNLFIGASSAVLIIAGVSERSLIGG